ncbi:MAG: hypothetical protein HOW73_27165 [Polyangiaceae bacterium]|nr:hypothetical protein [Polyangiaceae bacterium]
MTKSIASLLLLAPSVALLVESAGCACTLVLVYSGTETTLVIAQDAASLDGAGVRACLDDDCVTADLVTQGGAIFCDGERSSPPFIQCFGEERAEGLSLQVSLLIPDGAAEDGDFYEFSVTAPGNPGEVLAEREGAVEYETSEPNGTFCGTVSNAKL